MRFHNVLDDLLGSPIRVRLLRILTRFPGQGFTGRELARTCGSSPSQTNAALKGLRDSGVIVLEVAGRSHIWRLSPEHVLRDLLIRVFKDEADSLGSLSSEIERLIRKLPVERALLFGSVARGDERPVSDVDLFLQVRSKGDKEEVENALSAASGRFALRFGNALSTLVLDSAQIRRSTNPRLNERLMKEGLELKR